MKKVADTLREILEKIKKASVKIIEKYKSFDRRKKTYAIAIFIFCFIMLWAFISAGIITANFNRAQVKGNQDEQKVDAKGIIITETKEGKKYFEIYGESGHYSNDHNIATLYNVVGNFYKDNEVAMSFQSSKGEYNEKSGEITLFDNTFIVLKDGVSLSADKLIWHGNGKHTDVIGHVKINKPGEMISLADRGIIREDYQQFKIIGNTTSKVYKKKGS